MSGRLGLWVAIFALGWASILVRWCGEVPALVISFYRMFWSALLLLGYLLWHRRGAGMNSLFLPPHGIWVLLAGLFLALHFFTWISSVQQTLISHSLVLESTHPIFALLLSPLLLKEKGSFRSVLAAAITLGGILLIGSQDWGSSGSRFTGDVLAVVSALLFTFYIFVARFVRQRLEILPYLVGVYGSAAVFLFWGMILQQQPLVRYSWQVHLFMLLLALIPTIVGHSLLNLAARRMKAYKVNFAVLGEPVLSSILAFLIFGEKPYGWFYPGAVLVLGGIYLAFSEKSRLQPRQEEG